MERMELMATFPISSWIVTPQRTYLSKDCKNMQKKPKHGRTRNRILTLTCFLEWCMFMYVYTYIYIYRSAKAKTLPFAANQTSISSNKSFPLQFFIFFLSQKCSNTHCKTPYSVHPKKHHPKQLPNSSGLPLSRNQDAIVQHWHPKV